MLDLDMGAYAAYVWPAWGISALVLGGLAWRIVARARKAARDLTAAERTAELTP